MLIENSFPRVLPPNPAMPSSRTIKALSGPSSSRSAKGKSVSSPRGRRAAKSVPIITGAEFDRRAEAGEDLSRYLDFGHPGSEAALLRALAASRKTT